MKIFNQGTSKPEASHAENDSAENGDMAWACEELVELDDVQLATVVGGAVAVGTEYDLTNLALGGGGGGLSVAVYFRGYWQDDPKNYDAYKLLLTTI